MESNLYKKYKTEIRQNLKKELNLKNIMQVPRVEKIVINIGQGNAKTDAKLLDISLEELTAITGQKPVITRSKKSIAAFAIRPGMPIGCKVTLRRDRMYAFMERLFNIVLPRVRDFKGVSLKGFDGNGNYTLGLKEQVIFPEIDYDKVQRVTGMNVTFVTTSDDDAKSRAMLKALGMPFAKR